MKTSLLCLFGLVANAAIAAGPNTVCPAAAVLPELDASYHACSNGYVDGSCQRFIAAFKKVTGRYDCQRSFDNGPVPAAWLAPDGALEDFIRLTWRLSTNKQFKDELYKGISTEARAFFASKDFQGVLDGALAEEYLERSQAMATTLKRGHP